SVTDGVDGGYFAYLAFSNANPAVRQTYEGVNGGKPFWEDATTWLERSPGFKLENVKTPLRIIALNNTYSLLGEWEWFAGLCRLGRPVEMVLVQDGSHILEKPWDRMISQQGNVDWFVFWLKHEEDPDPAKADQYRRWRELRNL